MLPASEKKKVDSYLRGTLWRFVLGGPLPLRGLA
jgi:hypothetical protein